MGVASPLRVRVTKGVGAVLVELILEEEKSSLKKKVEVGALIPGEALQMNIGEAGVVVEVEDNVLRNVAVGDVGWELAGETNWGQLQMAQYVGLESICHKAMHLRDTWRRAAGYRFMILSENVIHTVKLHALVFGLQFLDFGAKDVQIASMCFLRLIRSSVE